jgi:hypothetical protein
MKLGKTVVAVLPLEINRCSQPQRLVGILNKMNRAALLIGLLLLGSGRLVAQQDVFRWLNESNDRDR